MSLNSTMFIVGSSAEQAAEMVMNAEETVVAGDLALNQEPAIPRSALGAKIGSGANADVFEYGEGKVVKLFRDAGQLHDLNAELRNHMFIQQAGLPVPRVYEPVEIDGLPGLVYEHIRGSTVAERLFRPEGAGDIRMLARLLQKIHSVEVRYLDCSHIPRVKDVLNWQIDRGRGLTGSEKTAIKDMLRALPDRECLCHGDLNPLNVIIRDGSPVVIDWQGASIGNPAYDAMQLVLIWKYAVVPQGLVPDAFVTEFYLRREELNRMFTDEFVRVSGMPKAELEMWLAPVAAAKLNTGIGEEERAILLGAIRDRLRAFRS